MALAPPIIIPPNAQAGGQSTNGKLWIENIADNIDATLMDYAIHFRACACSCILKLCGDLSLWPNNMKPVDFLGESGWHALSSA